MADPTFEQEKHVKGLKRRLEGWREIILVLHSVLIWRKNWYPGLLAGIITLFFLILYQVEPSFLTLFSIGGLTIILLDYLVPTVLLSVVSTESWTGVKEKQLEDICREIAQFHNRGVNLASSFLKMRENKPVAYYAIVIVSLLTLAWIGGAVNNMLLTYFLVLGAVLAPGMKCNDLVNKYSCHLLSLARTTLKLQDGGGKNVKSE